MRRALKKATKKHGQLVDRLLPSSHPQSPAPGDPGSGSVSPAPRPPEQQATTEIQPTQVGLTQHTTLPQSTQAVDLLASMDPPGEPIPPAPLTGRHEYAEPEHEPSAISTTGSVVKEFLEVARDGSDLFLPLKAALVGVVKIWDICERTAGVNDCYKNLESRLAHLRAVTEALNKRGPLDSNLKHRLSNIAQSFDALARCIEAKIERGLARRVLESRADVDEVNEIMSKISVRIEAFLYESMVRVEISVGDILSRLSTVEEKELKKELTNWREIVQVNASALASRRVHEAAHDAQPKDAGCLSKTRVNVLSKFMSWVKEDPKSIFWLAGMAGTGKTSISVTLCRMLERDPDVLLGGTFFCSRTSGVVAQTDVRNILPTLAGLLADQSPKFAAELAAELRPASGAPVRRPVGDQIGSLLQRPLAALASESRPIVFVVDALDECSNERELAELLAAIVTCKCAANVKFILTSRPETHILSSPVADRSHNDILQLHTIGVGEVTEDIRLYISNAFITSPLAKPWYSDTEVEALATLSEGLFIFASTIIAYVLEVQSVKGRLSRLSTALSAVKDSKVVLGPLDAMYEFVLTRASDTARREPKELEETLRVLACILAARTPLSVSALADLLELETDELRESLKQLQAVVYVPEEGDRFGLRTLHASFGDFLFARRHIQPSFGDETLARGCLHVMRKRLHFNISQSQSSYEPNPATRPGSITLSLEYACMQWIYHIAVLAEPSTLDNEIDETLRPRFLFWLEVVSVLGRVWRAAAMLLLAASKIQLAEASQFFRDAHIFLTSSGETIERSAPHIYLSALPFAAKDSLIYRTFSHLLKGLVSIETSGIDRHGGRHVMTLTGHKDTVHSVAYSPDGRHIVSGSKDCTVRIWDLTLGEEMMSLQSDNDSAVDSVTFASDNKTIAAGTVSGIISVWGLSAGHWIPRQLDGHSSGVSCIRFSSNGTLLASGSYDKTVRLWRTQSNEQVFLMEGHDESVTVVEFSPTADILASGSWDQTIRFWNIVTGEPVGLLSGGHTRWIQSISFSPDGARLASGSYDQTIRLWEVDTKQCVATLHGHSSSVYSVKFSPDGYSLVSSGVDGVRLWVLAQDLENYPSVAFEGHSDSVYSATFSPDGRYIASAGGDCSIRIWNAGGDPSSARSLPAHAESVSSVAVSADGDFIVSGSFDRSVRIWSARTEDEMLSPLLGHTGKVYSVAISPDSCVIASASGDHTVRLWNVQTGEALGEAPQEYEDEFNSTAFSVDGRWLVSGSDDKTVRIWNFATRQPSGCGTLRCDAPVYAICISPNSQFVAAGDNDGHIYVWNVDTGERQYQPFDADVGLIWSIAFSPAGTRIVIGGEEMIGHVWDISSQPQQIFALEGHSDAIRSAAYSADGRSIGTGSEDRTVRLWDAETGSQLAILHGHTDNVRSVAFMPDSKSIVSGSWDSTIRIWDVDAACSRSSGYDNNPVAALEYASLKDGWLLGQSGELLLWVPVDYRSYLQTPSCTTLIGRRRVTVSMADGDQLHHGEDWISSWCGPLSV